MEFFSFSELEDLDLDLTEDLIQRDFTANTDHTENEESLLFHEPIVEGEAQLLPKASAQSTALAIPPEALISEPAVFLSDSVRVGQFGLDILPPLDNVRMVDIGRNTGLSFIPRILERTPAEVDISNGGNSTTFDRITEHEENAETANDVSLHIAPTFSHFDTQGDIKPQPSLSLEFGFVNYTPVNISKAKRKRESSPQPPKLDFRTIMDPSQPEQYIFEVDLPRKEPRMRKKSKKEIEHRKLITKITPCIRCRVYKLKCSEGTQCERCRITASGGPLWNRICYRVNILAMGNCDMLERNPFSTDFVESNGVRERISPTIAPKYGYVILVDGRAIALDCMRGPLALSSHENYLHHSLYFILEKIILLFDDFTKSSCRLDQLDQILLHLVVECLCSYFEKNILGKSERFFSILENSATLKRHRNDYKDHLERQSFIYSGLRCLESLLKEKGPRMSIIDSLNLLISGKPSSFFSMPVSVPLGAPGYLAFGF